MEPQVAGSNPVVHPIMKNPENKIHNLERKRIIEGIWYSKLMDKFPEIICCASTKKYCGFLFLRKPERFKIPMNKEKIKATKSFIKFLKKIDPDINMKIVAYPELSHTTNIKIINKADLENIKNKVKIENIDGLITNLKNIPLMILGADCPPIAVYDKKNEIIGIFHSGWKGTAGNIVGKGINILTQTFNSNPKNIYVIIGPGISKEYEVGEEVYNEFLKSGIFNKRELTNIFKKKNKEKTKYNLDLYKAILYELQKSKIPKENIEITTLRTDIDNDLFPSYRKEKEKADRFAFLIMMKDISDIEKEILDILKSGEILNVPDIIKKIKERKYKKMKISKYIKSRIMKAILNLYKNGKIIEAPFEKAYGFKIIDENEKATI